MEIRKDYVKTGQDSGSSPGSQPITSEERIIDQKKPFPKVTEEEMKRYAEQLRKEREENGGFGNGTFLMLYHSHEK